MFLRFTLLVFSLVAILWLFFPTSAHAYLDPGTGSYIFQLLLAGIVGLGFVIKIYWKRIKVFFTSIFSKDKEADIGEGEDA